MEAVIRVRSVYGDRHYVSRADYEGRRRHMLPLYTRDGRRWEDTPAGQRAARRSQATCLARDNIAEVLP